MFAYIKGEIIETNNKIVILENNGIGYNLYVANTDNYVIGDNKKVYTHIYIKENLKIIYGFDTMQSKQLFLNLISISGIGPKTGLNIIGSEDVNNINEAIVNGDEKFLTKLPGIGKKTASQIINELGNKIRVNSLNTTNYKLDALKEALIKLGYKSSNFNYLLNELDYSLELEDLIKDVLLKLI